MADRSTAIFDFRLRVIKKGAMRGTFYVYSRFGEVRCNSANGTPNFLSAVVVKGDAVALLFELWDAQDDRAAAKSMRRYVGKDDVVEVVDG